MFSCTNKSLFFSPYTWQDRGNGRFTARMPGAYLKLKTEHAGSISVWIDRTENAGCPAAAMPVLEYSVDHGPLQVVSVPPPEPDGDPLFALEIMKGGDPAVIHTAEINFRACNLMRKRWYNPDTHLTFAGVELSEGGRLVPPDLRPRLAIGFGDSITEGVGAEKTFVTWDDLSANRAAGSWFPLMCAALGCEYGQLGTGGQGLVLTTYTMASLVRTWNQYSEGVSRLSPEGRLLPEPDYIFCAMGTNDFDQETKVPFDLSDAAGKWLADVRKACPHARIFWLIPPLGQHDPEIRHAIQKRYDAGDRNVFLIDTVSVRDGFDLSGKASRYAGDGIHPGNEGSAILAALAAADVMNSFNQTATREN